MAAFCSAPKSGFLDFDETFEKSFCSSPPVAAEGGF
jgi:hypothetical protein